MEDLHIALENRDDPTDGRASIPIRGRRAYQVESKTNREAMWRPPSGMVLVLETRATDV